jgi:hypothetical protein
MRAILLSALALGFGVLATPTRAQADINNGQGYIYCELLDSGDAKSAYYTGIFPGDISNSTRISLDFTRYVEAHYPNPIGVADCTWEEERSSAQDRKQSDVSGSTGIYRIVETGWSE